MILFLEIVGAYLVLGLLFGLWFILGGLGRMDPVAREGGWGFRPPARKSCSATRS